MWKFFSQLCSHVSAKRNQCNQKLIKILAIQIFKPELQHEGVTWGTTFGAMVLIRLIKCRFFVLKCELYLQNGMGITDLGMWISVECRGVS
jgi:hypothetical protein